MDTVLGLVDESNQSASSNQQQQASAAAAAAAAAVVAMAVEQDVTAAIHAAAGASIPLPINQTTIQAMYAFVNQRNLLQRISRSVQPTQQQPQTAQQPQIAYFTSPQIAGPSTAAFVPVDMMSVFPPLLLPTTSAPGGQQQMPCILNQPVCDGCIYGGPNSTVRPHHNHPMPAAVHMTHSAASSRPVESRQQQQPQIAQPAPVSNVRSRDRQVVGAAVPQSETDRNCWETNRNNVPVPSMTSRRIENMRRREPNSLAASYHMMMDTVERAKQRKRLREEAEAAAAAASSSAASGDDAHVSTPGTSTALHPSISSPALAAETTVPPPPKLRRTASARDVRQAIDHVQADTVRRTPPLLPQQQQPPHQQQQQPPHQQQQQQQQQEHQQQQQQQQQQVTGTMPQQPNPSCRNCQLPSGSCNYLTVPRPQPGAVPCACGSVFCVHQPLPQLILLQQRQLLQQQQQQQQHQQHQQTVSTSSTAQQTSHQPVPQQPHPFYTNPLSSLTLPTQPASAVSGAHMNAASVLNAARAAHVTQPTMAGPTNPVAPQMSQVVRYGQRYLEQIVERQTRESQIWPSHSYMRGLNPEAFIVPITATAGYNPGRFLGLDMMVGWIQSDFLNLAERPPLDRHHMFGAPTNDPQPVGVTVQDIEKCTEKVQFVKDIEKPEEETERCTVCLSDFETGEEIRSLRCTHIFHPHCIDKWLVYNKKCPVCRLDVDKQLIVELENNSAATAVQSS